MSGERAIQYQSIWKEKRITDIAKQIGVTKQRVQQIVKSFVEYVRELGETKDVENLIELCRG